MNNIKINRLISSKIAKYLKMFGGILIVGPKWCGKTYQGELFAKSKCMIQENLDWYQNIINDNIHKNAIFNGEFPRLIDEWQLIPSIWDKTRILIDSNLNKSGQFILAGSTMINKSKIKHSGAGRIARIKMSTLTFYEILSCESKNQFISLSELFNNPNAFYSSESKYDLEWIGKNMIIGGWPSIYCKNNEEIRNNEAAKMYVDSIEDINGYIILKMKKAVINKLLKSVSRLNGCQINNTTILKDLNNEITRNTLPKYLEFLESIFLIDYLESWSLNVRSKTQIMTKPKMYLADPSIGLAILGINSYQKLINDSRLFGVYFENQVIKDLKVFAQSINAELFFYRDKNNFEVDAILQLEDGRWSPIEIKLSSSNDEVIETAAKKLLSIENKISTEYGLQSKPSFYMIITGSQFSYKRKDEVYVVPFTMLKP